MVFKEFTETQNFEKICQLIEAKQTLNITNIKDGLKEMVVFELSKTTHKKIIYITSSEKEAYKKQQTIIDGRIFERFPLEPIHSYFADAHSQEISFDRMKTISQFFEKKPVVVMTSIEALLAKLLRKEALIKKRVLLKSGGKVNLGELQSKLVQMGYERCTQVENKGQFAVRGGLIDVFSPEMEQPIRIDLFDDEIETLRLFDPVTQRSIKEKKKITLMPAKEITFSEAERKTIIEQNNDQDPALLETLNDEHLFAFLQEKASLLDYDQEAIIVWDEPQRCREQAKVFIKQAAHTFETLAEEEMPFSEMMNRFLSFEDLFQQSKSHPVLCLSVFDEPSKEETLKLDAKVLDPFAGRIDQIKAYFSDHRDYQINIFCKNKAEEKKVAFLLKDQEIDSERNKHPGGILFKRGHLSEGFQLNSPPMIGINISDLLKHTTPKKARRKKGKKIDAFTDLKIGEYVVHDIHGIGVYQGIEQISLDKITKDFMVIAYKGDDKLYIPIEQMDAVQVYIGNGDKKPKINRIGTPDWQRSKSKTKKAIEAMADELVELYARRRASKAYAFEADTSWQREFEDAFPYTETNDQLRCIEEIKKDMESDIPMDRLLCGDVGYGKTEVALRAAFKAIMEGKQVALLIPTTVLAQQHYDTISERMKAYPITIELMNRFRSPKEQKRIIEDLKTGKVDFIIGTHRIISKDVVFKDLGLLIIDEEQRFGVQAKEKMKKYRENIDVLTLSATPIPRTLHMSMTGIRDMSVIEEPPEGRQAVQTYVMRYNPEIIKEAIQRELDRQGQVYYIHNRIKDIYETASKINLMLPNARIAVAHGALGGKQLETIMRDFLEYQYDILVTTTIVESGLDVKNANTLIVDEGDHYGLSQLYQLRGRVGRSDRQAYAYITHKKEILSEVAAKRLEAIKDFTALGSGFKVAMRDLEIRGAGNILGAAQSGHLYTVGYEMYCRILEETIHEKLKGEPIKKALPVRLNLDVNGYIPSDYIKDESIKYDIYKKMTYLKTQSDYDELEQELIDRFGKMPQGIYNLMGMALIKNKVIRYQIIEIKQNKNKLLFIFDKTTELTPPPMETILKLHQKNQLRLKEGSEYVWSIVLKHTQGREMLKEIVTFLDECFEIKL